MKANGLVVAQLTLRQFEDEAHSAHNESVSVIFDDEAPFTNVFADHKGKNTMKPESSKHHKTHFDTRRRDTFHDSKRDNHEPQSKDKLPHHALPKMPFPTFAGVQPKIWINKCNNYFLMFSIPETLWVTAATMNLEDNAAKWWESYKLNNPAVTWQQFCTDIQDNFGSDDYRSSLNDLINLKQTGTVEEYTTQFQALQYDVTMHSGKYDELYFATQYVAGLKDEIKTIVEPQTPIAVNRDVTIAKIQQKMLDRGKQKYQRTNMGARPPQKVDAKPATNYGNLWHDRQLRDYHKANNLCYQCGEKYEPGHAEHCSKHNKPHVNALVANDLDRELSEEVLNEMAIEDMIIEDFCQLSLNAISGTEASNSIQLKATVHNKTMLILVDTGSSHSFVSSHFVNMLQLPTVSMPQ